MTPAGINPNTGDLNWQRLATYLVGDASNGVTLDANGSLVVASGSIGGTAPIVVTNGTQVSLAYLAPLATSAGSLTLNYTSPFYLSGGKLALACDGALSINGTRLTLSTVSPLGQAGGQLTLGITDGLQITGISNYVGVLAGFGLAVNAGGVFLDELDTGEQTLSSSLTWTGAVAPSTLSSAKYRWIQIGNLVTVWFKIVYGTAGTNNSEVNFSAPGDLPIPTNWAANTVNDVVAYGAGHLGTSIAGGASTGAGGSAIYFDGSGNLAISIHGSGVLVNAKAAWGTISYYA